VNTSLARHPSARRDRAASRCCHSNSPPVCGAGYVLCIRF